MVHDIMLDQSAAGTWNVFIDGEWYFEGTYEQCDQVRVTYTGIDDEEYYGDDGDADWHPEEYEEEV